MDLLKPYWARYWDYAKQPLAAAPEDDAFRWLLEEFRVSLFAQHLKTPVPVSAKRLDEMWGGRQK
nr:DUF3418 domain-containing protein [Methylogaea oryzae]